MQSLRLLPPASTAPTTDRLRPTTFDGFHFYDLDFCLRARRAGLTVAVDTTSTLRPPRAAGRVRRVTRHGVPDQVAPLGQAAALPNHFHATALAAAQDERCDCTRN